MAVRLVLDRDAVRRIPLDLVSPLVRTVAQPVERGAKRTVRIRTGAVRAGIGSKTRTTATKIVVKINSAHPRSMLEHNGAKPHKIPLKPRPPGPLLRFYWPKVGHVVFLRQVSHPGTKGSEFLTKPLVKHGEASGFRVLVDIHGMTGNL